MTNRQWYALVIGVAALTLGFWKYTSCSWRNAWPDHDGKMRQTVRMSVDGVRRGAEGSVTIAATAVYTPKAADDARTVPVPKFDKITLSLVGAGPRAQPTPIAVPKWKASNGESRAAITIPEVPDGDYLLRADYQTSLGAGTIDVPLPLYTPARVHVITDRPLYEPGNMVRFRAVVLRARDLAPLDHRPGRWVVTDPSGEVLLEESAPAGEWGVVAGTFPLDAGAPTGAWRIAWKSGDASDEVPFTVEPFTLPRFRIEAAPTAAYYRPDDAPAIRGAVLYSSGAPVAGAKLAITWRVAGDWPPPASWLEKLLPTQGATGANGRFELKLPVVPADLQGQVTLVARIAAVDPAGDRVEGSTSVLLSQDGISVDAVTELGDGLVAGFNNRLYVRVASPDGRVLPGAKIKVKRTWQADDPGIDAETDVDGVASLQIDPGPPVNVVIPAKPFRPAPRPPAVTRGAPEELIHGEGASLADQVAMDGWLAPLASCARWYDESGEVQVGLRVNAAGAIGLAAAGSAEPLDRCVVDLLKKQRLPAGGERLYELTFTFAEPDLPALEASVGSALDAPEALEALADALARRARDCLPRDLDGALPRALTWSVRAGSKEVQLGGWIDDPAGDETGRAMACVTSRLNGAKMTLPAAADSDALGLLRFAITSPGAAAEDRPQPTTMLGYELLVSADVAGAPSTKLRLTPGEIPALRLRVTPVLAKAGETITAELIRGPTFDGVLPKEIELRHLKGKQTEKLDQKHTARLKIDDDTEGWCEILAGGARALVYVRPEADLTVTLKPGQERYGPGQQAELAIQTLIGGQGGQAAVGLFGVDDSLSQLVALPGPGDLARVRPQVETSAPAFGVLDGQALTLGRIRGAHAAAATVLRVTAIPGPPALDAVVSASAETRFDPIAELTDSFYAVLAELHTQVRTWETTAPPTEQMTPATMKKLWEAALRAAEQRGQPVVDGYGRRLRLHRLPPDLLALTDPRAVVVVGTRLPEDVENWAAWVRKERP